MLSAVCVGSSQTTLQCKERQKPHSQVPAHKNTFQYYSSVDT